VRPESKQHLARSRKWDTTGVLLDESVVSGRIDAGFLRRTFGRSAPVELEIGTGKGTFLLARASACPEHDFLGVEYARAYCHYAADRIRRAGLGNVRMLRAEAGHLFKSVLADECLWRVYILFPDPWPKRKHRRRRLIQPDFAVQLVRTLKPGGIVTVVTDYLEYFRQILSVLDEAPKLARVGLPRMSNAEGELTGTNFERKYIAQGRVFYATARMRYR